MGLIKIDELKKCETTKEVINKMFEMCYTTTELLDKDPSCEEKQMYLAKVESFKGNRHKMFGYYMKHKKIVEDKETCFDSFFKAAENVYYKLFNTEIEKNDMEEHIQEARLVALEVLYNFIDADSTALLDFKRYTVNEFCNLLINKDNSNVLYTYLLKSIKSKAYRSLYNNSNNTSSSRDYYTVPTQKDGVRSTQRVNVDYVFLDKLSASKDSDEALNKYSILDIYNQKEGNKIDVEGLVFSSGADTSCLKYIIDNRDKIFTKKQLEKLELLLKCNKQFGDPSNRKRYERDFVKKAFEKLVNDKYCYIENEQIRVKNIDFLNTVESIINAPTPLEQFDIIKNTLFSKSNFTNTLFIDIIYSLDEDVIRDLVYCLTEEVDERWLETDNFNIIIQKLTSEYNYQIKNANMIYSYNNKQKLSKEDKVRNYIEKYCFFVQDQEFGLVAKSSTSNGRIPNLQEITDFVNNIYQENFEKKQIRTFLKSLGYDVDVYKRTTRNKIFCYKIFRI